MELSPKLVIARSHKYLSTMLDSVIRHLVTVPGVELVNVSSGGSLKSEEQDQEEQRVKDDNWGPGRWLLK